MTKKLIYTIVPESTYNGGYLAGYYNDDEVVRPSYCYLHGKLETLIGYDIFGMLRSELEPDQIIDNRVSDKFVEGIHSCICMGKPCTFFRWKTNEHHKSFAGLVVLNSDTRALEYAQECYDNKTSNI